MAVNTPTRGLTSFAEHHIAHHLADEVLKDRFLYCPQLGWMQWDGIVWKRHADREGLAVKAAFRTYLEAWLRAEVTNLIGVQVQALLGYVKVAGLDRLERAVKTIEGVAVDAAWFDRDPWMLNTPSGVLDLMDGSLTDHLPLFGMTRVTGASYRPGATHPDWEQVLTALPDAETAGWLQAYLGRGLLGTQGGVEYVPFALGSGSNGKSLLLGSVQRALGEYAGVVSGDLLAGQVHEEQVMRLRGLRLAVIEELSDGHRLNVARLKQIVATDRMLGRHLYREAVEWQPTHTMIVTSNYLPVVPETDHGTWRRLVGVPFPHEYAPDPGLKQRCYEDVAVQEAVLAWLVEGAGRSMPASFPKAVEEHTAMWRQSVDLIASFVDECLVADLDGRVTKAQMLERFNDHVVASGHRRMTGRTFTERFRDHKIVRDLGVTEAMSHGVRSWLGVALKAPEMTP